MQDGGVESKGNLVVDLQGKIDCSFTSILCIDSVYTTYTHNITQYESHCIFTIQGIQRQCSRSTDIFH